MLGQSKMGKSLYTYKMLQIATFQPKFDKVYFFRQHSQPLRDFMQKEIEDFDFVSALNFEFLDSLKTTVKINW